MGRGWGAPGQKANGLGHGRTFCCLHGLLVPDAAEGANQDEVL
jgi:hypothetical protein